MKSSIRRLASGIGMGLMAGAAGTAAMTMMQMAEMAIAERQASTAPADTIEKILAVKTETDESKARLSNVAHWMYGTSLGAGRGVLAAVGVPHNVADPLFFAAVWGAPQVYLPALDVSPPVTEWSPKTIATDVAHHLVYAAVVAAVYRWLDPPVGWFRRLMAR